MLACRSVLAIRCYDQSIPAFRLLLPPIKNAVAVIMGDKGNTDPSLTVAQMVTLINKDHRDPRWNEIHQPEVTAYGQLRH